MEVRNTVAMLGTLSMLVGALIAPAAAALAERQRDDEQAELIVERKA